MALYHIKQSVKNQDTLIIRTLFAVPKVSIRVAPIPDFTNTSSIALLYNVFTSTSTDTDTGKHYRICNQS